MRRVGWMGWAAVAMIVVPVWSAGAQPVSPSPEARPRGQPASQSSVSTSAPPAGVSQTTGATTQDPTVKEMNSTEKAKVEKEGK